MLSEPSKLALREAHVRACLEVRGGCSEWEVEIEGQPARAVAYGSLLGAPLRPGDRVLLNTTAAELRLGTGGVHFIVAVAGSGSEDQVQSASHSSFPGREAGHILKLRYTPLQHRVMAAEEEASPHHGAVRDFKSLAGLPVVAAELHSQVGAVALAARAAWPEARIAYLQLDSAALPVSFSRLAARLREDGVLTASVSTGQSFGGDFETVNVYTGLIVASEVIRADMVVVGQGPGNVGTGTAYGFSGLSLVEALHAADTLGGFAILTPRMSAADPRERHQGLSHHTRTLLECLRCPVTLPFPPKASPQAEWGSRGHTTAVSDPDPIMPALEPYAAFLTTMGRSLAEESLFFRAAAAAGVFGAGLGRQRRIDPS